MSSFDSHHYPQLSSSLEKYKQRPPSPQSSPLWGEEAASQEMSPRPIGERKLPLKKCPLAPMGRGSCLSTNVLSPLWGEEAASQRMSPRPIGERVRGCGGDVSTESKNGHFYLIATQ